MTTTPTSGAAIQRYKIGYHADEWGQRSSTPSGIPDASGSWVRYADHVTALAAGQATAAQAGAPANMRLCYSCGHPADAHPWVNDPRGGKRRGDCPAAPAQPAAPQGVACAEQIPCGPKAILYAPLPDPAIRHEGGGYYNIYQLELFADRTHALRASHGQALRLLTQKEKDSLGRRAEGMDGNEWDQWVQEKFAQVNGLKVQGGSYEWDRE